MDTNIENVQRLKSLMVSPIVHQRVKLAATRKNESLQAFVERVLMKELERAGNRAA